jgi:hypothetical protein
MLHAQDDLNHLVCISFIDLSTMKSRIVSGVYYLINLGQRE